MIELHTKNVGSPENENRRNEISNYRNDEFRNVLVFCELEERLEFVQNAIIEAERCNGINLH